MPSFIDCFSTAVLQQETLTDLLRVKGLQSFERKTHHSALSFRVLAGLLHENVSVFLVQSGQMKLFANFVDGLIAVVLEDAV